MMLTVEGIVVLLAKTQKSITHCSLLVPIDRCAVAIWKGSGTRSPAASPVRALHSL